MISVIMPVYGRKDMIRYALDSYLRQDVESELVIVDDCSPEDMWPVISEYMDKDERISYHANETNMGQAFSNNKAMQLAKGDIICQLHTDGFHKPDVVVNLAGVCHFQPLEKMDLSLVKDEIDTNIWGAINIAFACKKFSVDKIIFIGSVSGIYGKKNQIGYGATKRALISIIQTMKQEGMKSYLISPGAINTKLRNRLFPKEDKKRRMKLREITSLIFDCIDGKFNPGDNIIIHKFGHETYVRVNNDDPWNAYIIRENT